MFDKSKPTIFVAEFTQQGIDTHAKLIQLERYIFFTEIFFPLNEYNIVPVLGVNGLNSL